MTRIVASLLIFAAFVVAPLACSAAPVTVPSDLSAGDKYRLAFVTNTGIDALSSNIADYNSFVTAVAAGVPELAALGTTWTAIVSTEDDDARDNTETNPFIDGVGVPIYRLDDTRLADDNADLWDGSLAAVLDIDESASATSTINVWTGTSISGTWMEIVWPIFPNPRVPMTGRSDRLDNGWIQATIFVQAHISKPVYAISAPITVIPEPSSMILVCIGATAVVGWQLRRRRHRRA